MSGGVGLRAATLDESGKSEVVVVGGYHPLVPAPSSAVPLFAPTLGGALRQALALPPVATVRIMRCG